MARVLSVCLYPCRVMPKMERMSRFEIAVWSQDDYVSSKKANGTFGMLLLSGRGYCLSLFIGRCAIKLFNYHEVT